MEDTRKVEVSQESKTPIANLSEKGQTADVKVKNDTGDVVGNPEEHKAAKVEKDTPV